MPLTYCTCLSATLYDAWSADLVPAPSQPPPDAALLRGQPRRRATSLSGSSGETYARPCTHRRVIGSFGCLVHGAQHHCHGCAVWLFAGCAGRPAASRFPPLPCTNAAIIAGSRRSGSIILCVAFDRVRTAHPSAASAGSSCRRRMRRSSRRTSSAQPTAARSTRTPIGTMRSPRTMGSISVPIPSAANGTTAGGWCAGTRAANGSCAPSAHARRPCRSTWRSAGCATKPRRKDYTLRRHHLPLKSHFLSSTTSNNRCNYTCSRVCTHQYRHKLLPRPSRRDCAQRCR